MRARQSLSPGSTSFESHLTDLSIALTSCSIESHNGVIWAEHKKATEKRGEANLESRLSRRLARPQLNSGCPSSKFEVRMSEGSKTGTLEVSLSEQT